jgi:hypothetical protein
MNSLQSVRDNDIEIDKMLLLMTTIIKELVEINERYPRKLKNKSNNIAIIMYGLRYMSSDNVHVRGIISALVPKVQVHMYTYMIYTYKYMHSYTHTHSYMYLYINIYIHIYIYISYPHTHIYVQNSIAIFKPRDLSNALYGMQVYTYIYVCMYVLYVYVYTYIYIYVYIYLDLYLYINTYTYIYVYIQI